MHTSQHWATLAEKWLEQGYPLSPQMIMDFPEHKLVKRWKKQRIDGIINA